MGSPFSKSEAPDPETNFPTKIHNLNWTIKSTQLQEITELTLNLNDEALGLHKTKWSIAFRRNPISRKFNFMLQKIVPPSDIYQYDDPLLVRVRLSIIGSSNTHQVYAPFVKGACNRYRTLIELDPEDLIHYTSYEALLGSGVSLKFQIQFTVQSRISWYVSKALEQGVDYYTLKSIVISHWDEDIMSNMTAWGDKNELTDVTLHMKKDNVKLFAHKIVLSVRIPVFNGIFHQDNAKDVVEIKRIHSVVMRDVILNYVYMGELPCPAETESWKIWVIYPEEVIHAATTYGLDQLRAFCDVNLVHVCTKDNFLDLYFLARRYRLKIACSRIRQQFKIPMSIGDVDDQLPTKRQRVN